MKTFKLIYQDQNNKTIVEIFNDKKDAHMVYYRILLLKKLQANNNIKIISKNF